MSFKFLFTLSGVLILNSSIACDFCGCYMGITPYDNHSNISLLYRYKSFNGYPYQNQKNQLFPSTRKYSIPSNNQNQSGLRHGAHTSGVIDSVKSQRDYEIFTTAELRGKFFIHERIEFNVVLPFVMNYNRINENKQSIKGIGDISVFAAYHLISKILTEKYQHRLILGGGVKLPVGDYYQKNNDGYRIDYMLQPGTGSVDYLGFVNYVFGYKKMGINFNSTYKMNGKNYYHERIGNASTNYLNVFYKLRQEEFFKIFPSIQAYCEYSKGLYINNVYQRATAMNIFTAGLGLDLFYKNFALNMSFQLPVCETQYESNMKNSCRAMVGLTYNFNQTKYLLKSKKQE